MSNRPAKNHSLEKSSDNCMHKKLFQKIFFDKLFQNWFFFWILAKFVADGLKQNGLEGKTQEKHV